MTLVSLGTALLPELNDPQAEVGVQLQVTPPEEASLITVAEMVLVAPGASNVGGAGLKAMEVAPVMVMAGALL